MREQLSIYFLGDFFFICKSLNQETFDQVQIGDFAFWHLKTTDMEGETEIAVVAYYAWHDVPEWCRYVAYFNAFSFLVFF